MHSCTITLVAVWLFQGFYQGPARAQHRPACLLPNGQMAIQISPSLAHASLLHPAKKAAWCTHRDRLGVVKKPSYIA